MSRPVITAAPAGSLSREEVKFWLEIMREHAVFIKLGLPVDSANLIQEADSFYKDITRLLQRGAKVTGDKQFLRLIGDSIDIIAEFLRYKRHLLHQMLTCKVGGSNLPLMLDHMAREAEYVLVVFGKIGREAKHLHLSKTREAVFWIRLMADHTKLIRSHIDPVERAIMHTVDDFANEFDDLFLEANDFYSMLTHPSQLPFTGTGKKVKSSSYSVLPHLNPPAYDRFLHDVRSSVLRLRDFKKALHKMTVDCRMVSILPPLLADHLHREAEHFLMVMAMIEKGMISESGDYSEMLSAAEGESNYTVGVAVSNAGMSGELIAEADDDNDSDDDDWDCNADSDCGGKGDGQYAADDNDNEDDEDDCDDDDFPIAREELQTEADIDDLDDDDDWNKRLPDNHEQPHHTSGAAPAVQAQVKSVAALKAAKQDSQPAAKEKAVQPAKQDGHKWSVKWPRPLGKSGG